MLDFVTIERIEGRGGEDAAEIPNHRFYFHASIFAYFDRRLKRGELVNRLLFEISAEKINQRFDQGYQVPIRTGESHRKEETPD